MRPAVTRDRPVALREYARVEVGRGIAYVPFEDDTEDFIPGGATRRVTQGRLAKRLEAVNEEGAWGRDVVRWLAESIARQGIPWMTSEAPEARLLRQYADVMTKAGTPSFYATFPVALQKALEALAGKSGGA